MPTRGTSTRSTWLRARGVAACGFPSCCSRAASDGRSDSVSDAGYAACSGSIFDFSYTGYAACSGAIFDFSDAGSAACSGSFFGFSDTHGYCSSFEPGTVVDATDRSFRTGIRAVRCAGRAPDCVRPDGGSRRTTSRRRR